MPVICRGDEVTDVQLKVKLVSVLAALQLAAEVIDTTQDVNSWVQISCRRGLEIGKRALKAGQLVETLDRESATSINVSTASRTSSCNKLPVTSNGTDCRQSKAVSAGKRLVPLACRALITAQGSIVDVVARLGIVDAERVESDTASPCEAVAPQSAITAAQKTVDSILSSVSCN